MPRNRMPPPPVSSRFRYESQPEVAAFARQRETLGLETAERALVPLAFPPGAHLLDVGAGAGREALGLARLGYRVTAVDVSLAMVRAGARAARERGLSMRWLQGDARALPVASDAYDGAVLIAQLLEHFHGRAVRLGVLAEAARAVRPGGRLLVSVHHGLWAPGFRRWLWRYLERRSEGLLPSAGGDTVLRRIVRRQSWLRRADLEDALRLGAQRARFEAVCAARQTWRALGGQALESGDGWNAVVSEAGYLGSRIPFHAYRPGELERDARAVGLRVLTERPHRDPPPGPGSGIARAGDIRRYVVLEKA